MPLLPYLNSSVTIYFQNAPLTELSNSGADLSQLSLNPSVTYVDGRSTDGKPFYPSAAVRDMLSNALLANVPFSHPVNVRSKCITAHIMKFAHIMKLSNHIINLMHIKTKAHNIMRNIHNIMRLYQHIM